MQKNIEFNWHYIYEKKDFRCALNIDIAQYVLLKIKYNKCANADSLEKIGNLPHEKTTLCKNLKKENDNFLSLKYFQEGTLEEKYNYFYSRYSDIINNCIDCEFNIHFYCKNDKEKIEKILGLDNKALSEENREFLLFEQNNYKYESFFDENSQYIKIKIDLFEKCVFEDSLKIQDKMHEAVLKIAQEKKINQEIAEIIAKEMKTMPQINSPENEVKFQSKYIKSEYIKEIISEMCEKTGRRKEKILNDLQAIIDEVQAKKKEKQGIIDEMEEQKQAILDELQAKKKEKQGIIDEMEKQKQEIIDKWQAKQQEIYTAKKELQLYRTILALTSTIKQTILDEN